MRGCVALLEEGVGSGGRERGRALGITGRKEREGDCGDGRMCESIAEKGVVWSEGYEGQGAEAWCGEKVRLAWWARRGMAR